MQYRVGIGHDTHRFGGDRPLKLAGVAIPYAKGLVGHSDADVVLHALIDALLGATGGGDIGERFPDFDPANENRDSSDMLREILAAPHCIGLEIVNVDCIVFAEQPKLVPYKHAMRERLAELLSLTPDRVNVKAKTGEKVGPIGRMEAISAEVVVLVKLAS